MRLRLTSWFIVIEFLSSLISPSGSQYLMTPYSAQDEFPIMITGWRHHLKLMEIDEEKIIEFIRAYQDRAPLTTLRGN